VANADVIMPKMGDGMTEGKLLAWKVQDGATVKEGDIIAEIETDKSAVEVPAEESGVFHILLKEGEMVPVGTKIATIGDAAAESTSKAAPAKSEAKSEAKLDATGSAVAAPPVVASAPPVG
jgi:pyruvate/2-oxoglutarate dehydrogenase complex dihydrolipoamide acyltransferase (E2) component